MNNKNIKMENKYKNSKNKKAGALGKNVQGSKQPRSRVLSLAQLLSRVRKQRGSAIQGNFGLQRTTGSEGKGKDMQQGLNIANAGNYDGSLRADAKQTRTSQTQLATQFGGSFGNGNATRFTSNTRSLGDVRTTRNSGRSTGEAGFNVQRVRENMWQGGNMTKAQIRLESQKEDQKRQKPIKPIIPPKSLVIILREKPEKIIYNRRIIDYKHCGLLQRYIGLGGKILPRRQTRLTAKQQRYIAKTIKSARIMGLLPFVSKEKGFFR